MAATSHVGQQFTIDGVSSKPELNGEYMPDHPVLPAAELPPLQGRVGSLQSFNKESSRCRLPCCSQSSPLLTIVHTLAALRTATIRTDPFVHAGHNSNGPLTLPLCLLLLLAKRPAECLRYVLSFSLAHNPQLSFHCTGSSHRLLAQ